jgi:hypothetical protein
MDFILDTTFLYILLNMSTDVVFFVAQFIEVVTF